jgi:hypothetical protein
VPRLTRGNIQNHIARLNPAFVAARSRAAKNRAHTRHEFARIERFRQVIVGAKLQPQNPIDVFASGRQDQHGHIRFRPQLSQHVEPPYPGQQQVENHDGMLS